MSTTTITEQLEAQRHKVDFDTYDITVQQLVSMVEDSTIDVAPTYQREFRWDTTRRSMLIESILLGVPVPSLFMASNKNGTWELVDGVQRLSTIVQFAGGEAAQERLGLTEPLVIKHVEKLTALNGCSFEQLPQSVRFQFNTRPIKVITLSDKSDTEVRFDLFERLNTGGVSLTNQEIRSCIYRGRFNQFLETLARECTAFRTVLKVNAHDGTREECVLRFFAFFYRYRDFGHSVVDFLNNYMKDASRDFSYTENEALFHLVFAELAAALPDGIVRRVGQKRTPINLYEGVSVGAALALQQQPQINTANVQQWIDSPELRRYTTAATNNPRMVAGRIEYCRQRFLET